jgi:hypothetical protein
MDYTQWTKQTKESWLNSVMKRNKDLSQEILELKIEPEIIAKSFAFPTDITNEGVSLKPGDGRSPWKAGIDLSAYKGVLLKSALDLALQNGIEYIHIPLDDRTDTNFLADLLNGVYLNMIDSKWHVPNQEVLDLTTLYFNQNFNAAKFYLVNDDSTTNFNQTSFRSYFYKLGPYNSKTWSSTLAKMIRELQPDESGLSNILIEVNLSNDLLLNISSIRALKLVLQKIWSVYNIHSHIMIEARPDQNVLTTDIHSNIYKMTSIALSASISSVDYICLYPADEGKSAQSLDWLKTSIHSLHILKQESNLSEIYDPLAGSYYVEDLTEQICQNLWNHLKEISNHD